MGRRYGPYNHMIIRPWRVSVDGFACSVVYAATRGQAMADVWRSDVFGGIPFGEFMRKCRVHTASTAPDRRLGDSIMVSGEPAFFAYEDGQYVHFSWPGGTHLYCSHPTDVLPESFRPTPYRSKAA